MGYHTAIRVRFALAFSVLGRLTVGNLVSTALNVARPKNAVWMIIDAFELQYAGV